MRSQARKAELCAGSASRRSACRDRLGYIMDVVALWAGWPKISIADGLLESETRRCCHTQPECQASAGHVETSGRPASGRRTTLRLLCHDPKSDCVPHGRQPQRPTILLRSALSFDDRIHRWNIASFDSSRIKLDLY